jgi:hypothetical protein
MTTRFSGISFISTFTMKRLALLCLFTSACFTTTASSRISESLAPSAIKSVIDEYFARNVHEIEVISFGTRQGQAEETIEKLLRFGQQLMPMGITRDARELLQSDELNLSQSSILLFDSVKNYKETQKRIDFQPQQIKRLHHLVYIHNATIDDIQMPFNESSLIDNIDFLVNETRHSIELATAFLFTPDACHSNQFKVINRFTRQSKQWENSNFFVEKYSNFHRCPMKFSTNRPFLATELNVTVKHKKGKMSMGRSIMFCFEYLPGEMMDLFNVYVTDIEPRKIFIPPGELYGEYEKMLLPFDNPTWIALAVTILVSILMILAIKLLPLEIQNVIFGRNNRSPLMNFFDIMLNGGQYPTIMENTSRILFMTLILWS